MPDRRPRPPHASERAFGAAVIAIGVCALRPEGWPPAMVPSWLEPDVLFALALFASSIAQADSFHCGARAREPSQALRRITRSAYLKIYLVVGINQAMAWIHGDRGLPRDLQQLRLLVAWGIAATVVARVWAGLRVRRSNAAVPIPRSAIPALRLRSAGECSLSAEPPDPLPPSTDDRS